jgi:hypothetical protein
MLQMPKLYVNLPWTHIWFTILLAGSLYMAGQYLGAGGPERSIQRQYDLMKVEQQELLGSVRRSLERERLHVEGEKQ